MDTIGKLYAEYSSVGSDMRDHCPTLRRLAAEAGHCTEFGVRTGISTAALLAGAVDGGGFLVSYDTDECGDARRVIGPVAGERWRFVRGNSLEVTIAPTRLLMIDTIHTGAHLWKELTSHEAKVRRYIVMHDTQEYALVGDDGGEGMALALGRFLHCYPHWRLAEHHKHMHGLTVLRRSGVGD